MVKEMGEQYDAQYLDEIINYDTLEEIKNNPNTGYTLLNEIYANLPCKVKEINEDIKKSDFSVGRTLDGDGLRLYLLDRADNIYEIRYELETGGKTQRYTLIKNKPSGLEIIFDTARQKSFVKNGEFAEHIKDFYQSEDRSGNAHLLVNLYAHFKNPGKVHQEDELKTARIIPKQLTGKNYLESIIGEDVMAKLMNGGRDITCQEAFTVYNAAQSAIEKRIDIGIIIPESIIRQAHDCMSI